MKKSIACILLAVLLISSVALNGCSSGGTKDSGTSTSSGGETKQNKPAKPIKIGAELPLTGKVANQGQSMKIALDIAVEKINKDGGINGSPVELVISDDQMDPQQSVTEYRKLLNEDVVAVLGPMGSGNFQIVSPIANQLKVPTINPNGIKVGIASLPWALRTMPTDGETLPEGVAAFKKVYPNIKKVVLLADVKNAAMAAALPIYRAVAKEQGLEIAGEVTYQEGTTDFSPVISKVKSYKPDALLVAMMEAEATLGAREMQRQGLDVPVLGTMAVQAGNFVNGIGSAGKNWYTVGVFGSQADAANQDAVEFVNKFAEISKTVSTIRQPANISASANLYDSIIIIADILRKGNMNGDTPIADAREKVRAGFMEIKDYNGVAGKLTMKPDGNGAYKARLLRVGVDEKIWLDVK